MNKERFEKAVESFINFDYKNCAAILADDVITNPVPVAVFLLIFSLRKLNRPELINNYAVHAAKIWDLSETDFNWEKTILSFCMDLESFEQMLTITEDPSKKSQLYFYESLKYLENIDQNYTKTVELLHQCRQQKVENFESEIAARLLDRISRYDFPDNQTRNDLASLYIDCVKGFINDDLASFIENYGLVVNIQNRHDLEEMLLHFLLKAGDYDTAKKLFYSKALNGLTYYGELWTPNLVALGLGLRDGNTVLGLADNDLKRCEAYYYIALQELVLERMEEAQDALKRCLSLDLTKYSTEANIAMLLYDKFFNQEEPQNNLQIYENLRKIISNPSSISAFYEERLIHKSLQFQDYNRQEVTQEAIELTKKCMDAFVSLEYEECSNIAAQRLKSGMNYWISLMELISLHRLGKRDVAVTKGRRYAEILDNRFGEVWYGHLLRLFIGSMTPEELLEKAETQTQRLQAFYYIGHYYFLKNEYETAYDLLLKGSDILPEEKCFEKSFIDIILDQISHFLDRKGDTANMPPFDIQMKLKDFQQSLPLINQMPNPADKYAAASEFADIFETYYPHSKYPLAVLYNLMSVANYDLGRINESEQQINHAIELLQSDEKTADTKFLVPYYIQKARILHYKGDFGSAVKMFQDLLKDVSDTGENILDYIDAFENLGIIYSETGDFERALPLAAKVVELTKRRDGDISEHVARVITNEAGLHERQGDYFYAKSRYEEALSIMESAVGKNNLGCARIWDKAEIRVKIGHSVHQIRCEVIFFLFP